MAWFKRESGELENSGEKTVRTEGLWVKCDGCRQIIWKKDLEENMNVCPKCDKHFRIDARTRLAQLLDDNLYETFDGDISSTDPLKFVDLKPYSSRLKQAQEDTGLNDAVINAQGKLMGRPVVASVMEYAFIGGSMGAVVGEAITRAVERAAETRMPLIIVSASGGARMMEGVISLMQLAKISAALARLDKAKVPYISLLTDPTTGGVTASFAMLGDLNIAEPGALIGLPFGSAPPRPNDSFGQIAYTQNNRYANYEAVTFDLRARASRGYFDVSYTRSSSKDDASRFPTPENPGVFYGPSPWDVPNRISASFNYEQPGLNGGQGFVGHATSGWGVSGTSIYQTGYPFTVFTSAAYNGANYVAGANAQTTQTGDYLANGDNFSFPNVTSYQQGTSVSAYTTGVFTAGQFTVPTAGTNGNERFNAFRNPAFIQTDMTVYKNTHINERLVFQLRFEFYNLFNHANFQNIQGDISQGNFGEVTAQTLPRWWQLGGKLYF